MMGGYVRAVSLLVSTSVRAAPWQSLACLGESAGVVLDALRPLYLAWLITGVIDRDLPTVTLAVLAFTAQIGIGRALMMLGMTARAGQLERVGYTLDTRIAHIIATLPTIELLDDPDTRDRLQILRDEEGSLGLAVNTLLNSLNTSIGVATTLALAISADPRLLLVAAAGAPAVLAAPLAVRWRARAETLSAEPSRLASHLLELTTQVASAGEIRIFNLGEPLRARLRDATRRWVAPRTAVAVRDTYLSLANQLVFFGTAGAVLAWILSDVIHGTTTAAALVLALLVVSQLQSTSAELQAVIGQVATMSRAAARYRWLVTLADNQQANYDGTGHVAVPLTGGLALDNASYTYPGANRSALNGITLEIPPGMTVAIVGENGAGKSTLVNVITGLAQPTSGSIRIDGIDIADLDLAHWREHLSGAFQDHVHFELTLGHAVGIGDLPQRDNDILVVAAIHQGTADHILATAPRGLATQLGPSWPSGIGLSGGQWQRIALSRGMMRTAAVVRVLDEPTSALDAHTEHEIFERYAATAATGHSTGTITLLVTHRFSTVAAADRVIVMRDGHITEAGTHTELIAMRGHYAELYNIQAKGYR